MKSTSHDAEIRTRGFALLEEGFNDVLFCSCLNYTGLTMGEMRHVVLAHQDLLNPPPPKRPSQPEVLTLKMAQELLDIGAE